MPTEKTAPKQLTPWQPGQSGNPKGRPKGARNKTTLAVEALLEGEAEAISRKAIEKAKDGDLTAIRLCLDQIAPPRKDRPVCFQLPQMQSISDAAGASAAIIAAVGKGALTPSEASELMKLVESFARTLQATDLEDRIERLEQVTAGRPGQ